MFFLHTLFALAGIAAAICAAPLRTKVWTALAFTAAGAAALSACAVGVLAGGEPRPLWAFDSLVLGRDSGSLDPLSAFFVLLIAVGAVAAVLYSRGYLSHALDRKSPAHVSLHYTALTVMSLSMLGVVASDGGYSFLFFWELMTVASFILILFDAERREVRRAALSYLIMMHIGFVLLVVGFVRLHAATGSASFAALVPYFAEHRFLPLFLVFLAGFGMKAGLFPMHVWLPEAHPAAPSHVSALMSGVMIKTGVYGILRVVAALDTSAALHTAGVIVLVAGIATGLWGVILAASQNDVKRLLAYSSIENVGVILIGAGVALLGKASGHPSVALCGMAGALLHTLNHSFFKSLLFFGAGNVLTQTHTTSLDALGGLAKHMPLTALLFLVGAAAICALPPLNGFVSELLIYLGLFKGIAAGGSVLASVAGVVALALIGGIVVLAFTKLYGTVFLGSPRTHEVAEAAEADSFRIAAMALPLAGILFVGFFPATAVGIVGRAAGFFLAAPPAVSDFLLSPVLSAVGRTAWLLVGVIGLLAWLRARTLRSRTVAQGPTWGCGFTSPNVRMQYTGESFSEGLQSIVPSLTQQKGEGDAVAKSEIFPSAHRYDIRRKDRIDRLFAAWWVEALRLLNQRAMRLRTGKINSYILFALAFLGLVFLLSVLHLL
ncbi:proton-conducting transporter membrane subunit [uncultured Alistipes sp.]|uniref:proton-conducting transporter transmembrane domain-containing protein n=1 Tax=uncultured Alistipes sp. TaxID=538949 RepID=UPI0025A999CB|nr:proton-conducting transporter membrane subunit [uncultured Alistipes sp.]